MWAFSIDDRTLLCLAVNVTKHGISNNFGRNNVKFSKTVVYITYIVFQCSLSQGYYRKRGSASYILREVLSVREREIQTDRDRSDVTIVALKLAMNSHFPLPKIRNWRWAYTFPCQKFALLVSPFTLPVAPFTERFTIVALKIAMSSHFPLPKFFSPSLFPLFQMARASRRVIENPRQMIKSYPVLFCSSHRKNESN